MVISPNDFSLWARLTGNKYPSTPRERAQKGPEVQRFIQNLGKEGMLGGKQEEEQKKKKGLPEKLATGALIAGGIVAGVAAARDPRVQNVAQRAGSATKDKIKDFLVNFSEPRDVDVDIVDASGDVTPNPIEQQSNIAPQLTGTSAAGRLTSIGDNQVRDPELGLVTFDKGATPEQINNILTSIKMDRKLDRKAREGTLTRKDERQFLKKELTRSGTTPQELFGTDTIDNYLDQMASQGAFKNEQKPVAVDRFTPLSEGKTSFTEGAISKEDPYGDISNLGQRVDRTYRKYLSNLKPEDAAKTRESLIRGAARERDYALGYMNARARGRTDEQAAITGRKFAGYDLSPAVKPQTPFREALSNLKIASTVPAKIDDLLKLVETGPQIILPEKAQKINDGSSAIVLAGGGNNTNVIPTMGATIGGPSLTDQLATKMAVDNALDTIRATNEPKTLVGPYQAAPIKGITIAGPSNIQRPGPDTVVERNKAGDITFTGDANYFPGQRELPIIYSTQRGTNEQLRRREFTPEQVRRLTEPKQEFSPEPPSDPTSREARMDRLEQSMAETRALGANLARTGELLSNAATGKYLPGLPGSITRLVPGTDRFDSARAIGYSSIPGVDAKITNPNFQNTVTLPGSIERALPTSKRIFYRTDSEGRPIPETVQERDERKAIITTPKGGGGRKAGETAGPPRSPLDTLIIQAQNPAGMMTTTRPVFEEIDNTSNRSFVNPVQSGGLEQSPPDFGQPSVSGRSIGKYGVELGDIPQASEFQTPTESPTSFTQAPGRARGPIDIVVSGGRANNNKFDTRTGGGYEGFKAEMDNIIGQMGIPESKTINIISGGASGVDSYAAQYANEKRQQGANFTSEITKADWSKGGTLPPAAPGQKPVPDLPGKPGNYDPKAGGARNQRMINKAEAAIVFDGGTGTEDFTRRAERKQKTSRFPVYNASDMGGSKNRFAGESFDVARELQKIQTNQNVSPEQRRINASNFLKNLETDAILRSIDYSDRPY